MSDPKPITYEDGYRRLQEITEEVNQAEVSVIGWPICSQKVRGSIRP